MTIDQFLADLRLTPRNWSLTGLTPTTPCGCPICTVASMRGVNYAGSSFAYWLAAPYLGLDSLTADAIAKAADAAGGHDPALRVRILQACGLLPEE